ncbi:glycosyltransferase [Alteromonas sp. KUL49]|uniref:glycosyltransferase n=1 Tax=Alteromonas sp. KUL49 TaxID=2480798 RepID=UPI00102EED14|nr:glycosyltransferase [Alteromonas sp. KUL49]TAP41437.1 glycosyltransferase family 1 protein [Alteromonas sp. KUL49]
MKTIFFAHSVNVIGGAERVTLATINGVKNEYRVVLIAPDEGNFGAAAKNEGAIFEPVSCIQPDFKSPFRTIFQGLKYLRLFRKHKPALVHCGDLLALRSVQPICKLLNIPIICHVHFPYGAGFVKWAFAKRYAPASFIFCSEELKDNLAPVIQDCCPTSEMLVIHNGVDTSVFSPRPLLPSQIPNVGIVANLQFRKGHDDFLEMANILLKKNILVKFHIIGGDILEEPREDILKNKAVDLGIDSSVTFHGQVPNVLELISTLDVYVCASHEEAFPISILEAMATGKTIVSTDVNGIPEAIDDGVEGLLVPPHSPEKLADAVMTVLEDKALATRLSTKARARVKGHFSQQVYIDKIQSLYAKY